MKCKLTRHSKGIFEMSITKKGKSGLAAHRCLPSSLTFMTDCLFSIYKLYIRKSLLLMRNHQLPTQRQVKHLAQVYNLTQNNWHRSGVKPTTFGSWTQSLCLLSHPGPIYMLDICDMVICPQTRILLGQPCLSGLYEIN